MSFISGMSGPAIIINWIQQGWNACFDRTKSMPARVFAIGLGLLPIVTIVALVVSIYFFGAPPKSAPPVVKPRMSGGVP